MAKGKKHQKEVRRRKKLQRKKKHTQQTTLIRPKPKLLLPMSPFQKRMRDMPIPSQELALSPEYQNGLAEFSKSLKNDIEFQAYLKELESLLPLWIDARLLSGSGLLMADQLRYYMREYATRFLINGITSLPSSFNIVEAFMGLHEKFHIFDLREEKEHLLTLDDYFYWYLNPGFSLEPEMLLTGMDEGVIYSYDMADTSYGFTVETEGAKIAIAGISLVRHSHELNCVLIAGENPPYPSDEVISTSLSSELSSFIGRDGVKAHSENTIKDRYLDMFPGFSKVILLTRFDLKHKSFDVRYVNLDVGQGFKVYTDDYSLFLELDGEAFTKYQGQMEEGLKRYNKLFSMATSLIYLPILFVDESENTHEQLLKTQFSVDTDHKFKKQVLANYNEPIYRNEKSVVCLRRNQPSENYSQEVDPPELHFKSEGYWQALPTGQIGKDKDGNNIAGRTWITRTESWSSLETEKFLLTRRKEFPKGDDPGTVYVMRSSAHVKGIYKIGLTHRTSEERASDLSKSATPIGYAVLADFEVGNCREVERKIHERLKAFRVNPKREFFRCDLKLIIDTIHAVTSEID
ncbi:GIY-YIG nuclease family protein [Gimesia chilikensis]|uniref:GIY-YIG nuclease family protein n=1 Tax=Gimesia chilikensis TaxID=2605989 RepID=UPI001187B04A|nr:GIY-YIG nuclease family protein [Gimesia chilikensis]QDT84604.1 hypothetical protein MalM14_22640 [Gimesia chilikensis]